MESMKVKILHSFSKKVFVKSKLVPKNVKKPAEELCDVISIKRSL